LEFQEEKNKRGGKRGIRMKVHQKKNLREKKIYETLGRRKEIEEAHKEKKKGRKEERRRKKKPVLAWGNQ